MPMKPLRMFRLARTVTYTEYAHVPARSLAEAKREARPQKRGPARATNWQLIGDPVVMSWEKPSA